MIWLRAIGVTCCIVVLNQHVPLQWYEGCLLSFGIMLAWGNK